MSAPDPPGQPVPETPAVRPLRRRDVAILAGEEIPAPAAAVALATGPASIRALLEPQSRPDPRRVWMVELLVVAFFCTAVSLTSTALPGAGGSRSSGSPAPSASCWPSSSSASSGRTAPRAARCCRRPTPTLQLLEAWALAHDQSGAALDAVAPEVHAANPLFQDLSEVARPAGSSTGPRRHPVPTDRLAATRRSITGLQERVRRARTDISVLAATPQRSTVGDSLDRLIVACPLETRRPGALEHAVRHGR